MNIQEPQVTLDYYYLSISDSMYLYNIINYTLNIIHLNFGKYVCHFTMQFGFKILCYYV